MRQNPGDMRALRRVAPWWAMAALVTLLAATGCEDSTAGGESGAGENNGEVGCTDYDGDGYGIGCARGEDCNDSNPEIQVCDCSQGNFAGCPCQEGATEACFEGVAGQQGVGVCTGGTRRCENGNWSPCFGQVLAQAEVCDNRDNDCDGSADEDLELNACGTCDPLCDGESVGQDGDTGWGLTDDNSEGLRENERNGLELVDSESNFDFIWVANSEEGTVSKINTQTGQEAARYVSALRVNPQTMPSSLERCDSNSNNPGGNCPSRTAVALNGDVWVANRAFRYQGSVTKIAHRDCVDRNGNGSIETSSDANGNGVIDMNNPQEFLGEADECILFTVPVGGVQSIPRALAIDPFAPVRGVGSVWVGAWSEQRYYQLDASNGNLIRTVDVPHNPYGAIMDRFGILWSIDLGSSNINVGPPRGLVKIISQSGEVGGPFRVRSTSRCEGGYGITIDGADNVWIGGFACESVFRYTPSSDSWLTVQMPGGTGYTRGIAADRDGWIYVGSSNNINTGDVVGHITRFRQEDGSQLQVFDFSNRGAGTIGVGLDNQGRVWGINNSTGNATRLDPSTGQTQHFPVGVGPYTYSDFSGFTLRNFTAPQGTFRRLFRGCPQKDFAMWRDITWEADTPPGTSVFVRVKTGMTLDDLVTAPYLGPWDESPADLAASGVPNGRFLEVEVTLTTDTPGITPTLWDLDVTWTCPPVL